MEQLNESIQFQNQYWVRRKRRGDPFEKFVKPENKYDSLIIYDVGKDMSHGDFVLQNSKMFEDEIGGKSFRNTISELRREILLRHRYSGEHPETLRGYLKGDITSYLIMNKDWLRIRQYLGTKKYFIDCKDIKQSRTEIMDFIFWGLEKDKIKPSDVIEINSWDKVKIEREYGDASHILKRLDLLETKSEKNKEKVLESKIDSVLRIMKVNDKN